MEIHSQHDIVLKDLHYKYPTGQSALREISFSISPGERVGLIGPNGAGKTTLFLCLSGVLKAQAGELAVGGLDPRRAADRKKIPGVLGIVFQNSDDQLFNSSVHDDVAFGPLNLGIAEAALPSLVAESLKRVGLEGFENRVPFQLSGGEKRRVALAGVLAMRPRIVLLDEPSIFLDPRGRRELIGLLNSLDITMMTASHDLEFIKETCTRVVLLDQGKIIAHGATIEILKNRELMEAHGLEVPHSLTYHPPAAAHHS